MKSFHGAGLVLIAWYLMVAPATNGKMNVNAPISQWKQSGSYDSEIECTTTRDRIVKLANAIGSTAPPGSVWAKCVADNDPSLKAK